jgi:hypothetical protein
MDELNAQSYGVLIGDLYARWTLDALIEIAHAVADDYVARPEFYRGDPDSGDHVPDHIVDLQISYGYVRNYPNKMQRSALNMAMLGMSDEHIPVKSGSARSDRFHQLREPLFKACIAYEERNITDATRGLKENVIVAMSHFPTWLRTFDGQSFRTAHKQIDSISNLAYSILRSRTVSGVFGVIPPPPLSWPLEADDQAGARLVDQISQMLKLGDSGLNQQEESLLRTIAEEGAEALEAILRESPTDDRHFEDLVSKVYSWAKAINNYSSVLVPVMPMTS